MTTMETFEDRLRARGFIKQPAAPEPRPVVINIDKDDPGVSRYVAKALEAEVTRVAQAVEGTRNDTLNRAAYSVGQLVAGGVLDPQVANDHLTAAARAVGLEDVEIRRTILSAFTSSADSPRGVPELRRVEVPELRPLEIDADGNPKPRAALEFYSLGAVAAEVDAAGDPEWLFTSLWPADAYGVLAAEDKAGKSWAVSDAAISVASGTHWMGKYECPTPGAVLLFFGEGGKRNLVRRMRAVGKARGLNADTLNIRVCERVPHLSSAEHLGLVYAELAEHPARLVIIDPLYLAARGSSGSDLYAMGEALEGIQHVCQTTGAALIVVTHFNKTGEGRGAKRITGVGPGAWGRVIGTAHVEHRDTDAVTRATDVILGWDFIGGEIPDTNLHIRRRIWADDPDALGSPLNYELTVIEDDFVSPNARPGLRPAAVRVLNILEASDRPLTVKEIGDLLADDGRPLKPRTIQDALQQLGEDVEGMTLDARGTTCWDLTNRAKA